MGTPAESSSRTSWSRPITIISTSSVERGYPTTRAPQPGPRPPGLSCLRPERPQQRLGLRRRVAIGHHDVEHATDPSADCKGGHQLRAGQPVRRSGRLPLSIDPGCEGTHPRRFSGSASTWPSVLHSDAALARITGRFKLRRALGTCAPRFPIERSWRRLAPASAIIGVHRAAQLCSTITMKEGRDLRP